MPQCWRMHLSGLPQLWRIRLIVFRGESMGIFENEKVKILIITLENISLGRMGMSESQICKCIICVSFNENSERKTAGIF